MMISETQYIYLIIIISVYFIFLVIMIDSLFKKVLDKLEELKK